MTTPYTRGIRRLGKWTDGFIAEWHEAAKAGLNRKQLAELLDMPYDTVVTRFHALRRRGVILPELPHGNLLSTNGSGNLGKRAARKEPLRLEHKPLAPAASTDQPPPVLHASTDQPPPVLHFVIPVSA